MSRTQSVRCFKCHAFVTVVFTLGPHAPPSAVGWAPLFPDDKTWFSGDCPKCGAQNSVRKPTWAKEKAENV